MGSTSVRWDMRDIVVTWRGVIDGRDVVDVTGRVFTELMGGKSLRYFICDTLAVENYKMDIYSPAKDLLRSVKVAGARELLVAVDKPSISLVATTLSFVAGLKLHAFPSMVDLEKYIASAKV